jgi:dTDP-4-dehydrorhamnose reductase
LLICGAGGALGQALLKACDVRHLHARAATRVRLDICNAEAIERFLDEGRPWAVINAAGFVRVDQAEANEAECFAVNVTGPLRLTGAAERRGIPVLTYSSDLVFDGNSTTPYTESNATAPLCAYGRSKQALEIAALRYARTLCVRTAAFFGAWDHGDFLSDALQALSGGRTVRALGDVVISPTYVPDLADASLDLLIDGASGIYHLANRGAVSWSDFARLGAHALQLGSGRVLPVAQRDYGLAARRPAYSALTSERVNVMPPLDHALERFARIARKLWASSGRVALGAHRR